MLCLKRKEGEEILIGKDIIIRVMKIGLGRVQLGISAPQSVQVHRREVAERIDHIEDSNKELGGES